MKLSKEFLEIMLKEANLLYPKTSFIKSITKFFCISGTLSARQESILREMVEGSHERMVKEPKIPKECPDIPFSELTLSDYG